ncbi:MAG: hypothetical protein ICV69_02905 [Thermoleophilaceae bacterium]|nr:hypothetical protein [Thermoleophilaceae bacterium]
MRFVDLFSVPITQSPAETPESLRTDIEFSDHAERARQIETLLGVPPRLLRDGPAVTADATPWLYERGVQVWESTPRAGTAASPPGPRR